MSNEGIEKYLFTSNSHDTKDFMELYVSKTIYKPYL